MNSTGVLQAVLFDMDGTLIDTEGLWDISLQQTAEWLGGQLDPDVREGMWGSNLERSVRIVHAALGVDADPAATGDYLLERTAALFAGPLPWLPGARRLLDEVGERAVPAALVTSTHRRLTELALKTIGAHRFGAIVCGNEVERGKPDPQSYLRAAELLGADPRRCVVIEDSILGVSAGERAGAAVLAVPGGAEVAPAPTRTVVPSLVGVDLGFLRELVRRHAVTPP